MGCRRGDTQQVLSFARHAGGGDANPWESVGPTLKVMRSSRRRRLRVVWNADRHSLCCKCWPDVWEPCQLELLSQLQFATIDGLHYLCRNCGALQGLRPPVLDMLVSTVSGVSEPIQFHGSDISATEAVRVGWTALRAVMRTWGVDTQLQLSNWLRNQGFAATRPGHHIPALSGCRVKPRRPRSRRGFTRQPERPNVHIRAPRPSITPPEFHEKTHREEKRTNYEAEREKKAGNFGPSTLRAPTLRAPLFLGLGPHPSFGPPLFLGSGPHPVGPHTSGPTFSMFGPYPSGPPSWPLLFLGLGP